MKNTYYIRTIMTLLVIFLASIAVVSAVANTAPTFTTTLSTYDVDEADESFGYSFEVVGNLSSTVTDIDNDNLTFSILSESSSDIACSIIQNVTLNCTYVGPSLNALSVVSVRVDDGFGGYASDTVTVSVNNTNQAPYFTMPLFLLSPDTGLSSFGDVVSAIPNVTYRTADPNNDVLTISILDQTNLNISCVLVGESLDCTYVGPALNAVSVVTIGLDDGFGGYANDSLSITYNNSNQAPYFDISPSDYDFADDNKSFGYTSIIIDNLTSLVIDPNDDNLTFSILDESSTDITCSLDNNVTLNCTYVGPSLNALSVVTIGVDDGFGGYASDTVSVSVNNSNQAPYFDISPSDYDFADDNKSFGYASIIIDNLTSLVIDPNDDNLTFSILDESSTDITCSLVNNVTLNCTYVGPSLNALSIVTIGVDDGFGGYANDTVSVSVNNSNQAPYFVVSPSFYSIIDDNLSFGYTFNVITNLTSLIADPNGDVVSTSILSQSNANIDCTIVNESVTCSLVGSVVDAFSTITIGLDDGFGGYASDIVTVNLTDSDVLLITNVSNDASGTIEDGETVDVSFDSNKYPLTVVVEMVDGSDNTQKTSTYTVNSASELPVVFTAPSGETDGTYTLKVTVTSGTETVVVSAGSFVYDNTPSSSGGSSRRRGSGGTTFVGETIVVETPEPVVIDEIAPTPVDNGNAEVIEVVDNNGTLIVEGNETTDEVSGQFTGSDEPASLAWLWWLLALFIAAVLIWELSGKRK